VHGPLRLGNTVSPEFLTPRRHREVRASLRFKPYWDTSLRGFVSAGLSFSAQPDGYCGKPSATTVAATAASYDPASEG